MKTPKPQTGDRVNLKGTHNNGRVVGSRFALMSLKHMNFLPSTYYAVQLDNKNAYNKAKLMELRHEYKAKDLEVLIE